MATQKSANKSGGSGKSGASSSAPKKKTTVKTVAAQTTGKKQSSRTSPAKPVRTGSSPLNQILPYVFYVFALFLLICLIRHEWMGPVGLGVNWLFKGLFSLCSFSVPILLVMTGVYWQRDVNSNKVRSKLILSVFFILSLSVLYHVISTPSDTLNPTELFKNGLDMSGGGLIGGLIGSALLRLISTAGTLIIAIPSVLILGIFVFGLTPNAIRAYISSYVSAKATEAKAPKKVKTYRISPAKTKKHEQVIDINAYDDVASGIDGNPYVGEDDNKGVLSDEEQNEVISELGKPIKKSFEDVEGKVDLKTIFPEGDPIIAPGYGEDSEISSGDVTIEVERKNLIPVPEKETVPEKPEYKFPPIILLEPDRNPRGRQGDDVFRATGEKLVETLASFKVNTRIVAITPGPTVTRYELEPERGVRVSKISDLVNDIALSLAATSVRIEAPIPGKAAVGIEIPNSDVKTVYLRSLLERPEFKSSDKRLFCALGINISNQPVFVDLAKMPHLLIAGATGMGKSVCLNSLIISLLYKSTPDEVKLILIDPKKVEFNIYNGLPHLLVPVVSDPKKAAGALGWAVGEMERRFEMMESVGTRDMNSYNALVAQNPDCGQSEILPNIVIITDELADLMMTAKKEVEALICRLAQKARAAGIHLIIGTQRPSVDVITGLIKANIPSRIAFTVASQIDSRTILDVNGAEKLCGRGDMLYAPVGSPKPVRVQGAYVDEREVIAVTSFIKKNCGEREYDEGVAESIEREAASLGDKSDRQTDLSDDTNDPLLRPAIELAIDSGKLSTSLLQRKLSIGYGRAAKLLDSMQEMGIISPQEGNKPRNVLISRAEYLEMALGKSGFDEFDGN